MATSSEHSVMGPNVDSEPEPKRIKIAPSEGGLKPLSPSLYKSVKLTHFPDALYNDMSFEFSRLSDGRNLLLSESIFDVQSNGSIGNALAPLECETFTRVPGYDFALCSLTNFCVKNRGTRLGVFALPSMKAISTMEFRLRTEGRVEFIASDKSSKFGIGRILFCTKYMLFLVDVSKDGAASITNCVDMAACSALRTLKDQKESYRGIANGLLLYHDPFGNPIAVIGATGGRVVFLSMASSQCIPFAAYSSASSSVPAKEGQTVHTFFDKSLWDEDIVLPDVLPLDDPCGIVLPLRVLHLHRGQPDNQEFQERASVSAMCLWEPTRGGGSRLLTVGSDGQLTMSILDDGERFSDSCLPYHTFKCSSRHLAIHGDVAFTAQSYEMRGTFWDLSPQKGPVKLCVVEDLGRCMRSGKYMLMSMDFSDDGILAFTNSNDFDDPTLSFLTPT
jgi:hypothetical protein